MLAGPIEIHDLEVSCVAGHDFWGRSFSHGYSSRVEPQLRREWCLPLAPKHPDPRPRFCVRPASIAGYGGMCRPPEMQCDAMHQMTYFPAS